MTMFKSAYPPDDKIKRYSLTRIWDDQQKKLLFIMYNPSTADYKTDDPTIIRIINFAKKWEYGGIYVANLYAFRSTKPKEIKHLKINKILKI